MTPLAIDLTNMDYSKILNKAYSQFLLPLGGKKVSIPYRINDSDDYQKAGPEFQGKSSPEVLTETTEKLAAEQDFNLQEASTEEIRAFMEKNKLGIDCSGFAYRLLDYLVEKTQGKTLVEFGLPTVGRTNADILTSNEFCTPIKDLSKIEVGDHIRLASGSHVLVILETKDDQIIYAHSSVGEGVHQGKIKITNPKMPIESQDWSEEFLLKNWDSKLDGVKRLRILN